MSELVAHLKGWRTERGLTQQELAERVGVSRKTINTVENGVFIPSTTLALKLAATLGTTVEHLFELKADEPLCNGRRAPRVAAVPTPSRSMG